MPSSSSSLSSMAGDAGLEDDPLAPGCYSQLLFSDEDGCLSFPSDDHNCNPKMLCFGDYAKKCANGKKLDHKSQFTCMGSSPKNSYLNKKRNGSGIQNTGHSPGAPTGTGNKRNGKKLKLEKPAGGGHAKVVRKEKLGERITALQQLVSPFGKTDAASVLYEALSYIRFLHDQVQVLCSPYLQLSSSSSSQTPDTSDDGGDSKKSEGGKDDLRSRGLCIIPVNLTPQVADSNGADLWSSAATINSISSS